MKYYVTADVHGFFSIMRAELNKAGYFKDEEPRKLIICGDVMDRGAEAKKMQNFLLREMEADRLILIRGNHEDLFCQMVEEDAGLPYQHHVHNGTYDTALQLTGWDKTMAYIRHYEFAEEAKKTLFYQEIIPSSVDYFETENHVFVHGWIPGIVRWGGKFSYFENWREASSSDWERARWFNGMDAWPETQEKKTIVCGHWDVCYGHNRFEHHGGLRSDKPDFTPFVGEGIIALDACTVLSRKVNVVVINDD